MKCSHQLTLCNKFRFLLMTYEVIVSNLAIKREGTGNQIIVLWYPSLRPSLPCIRQLRPQYERQSKIRTTSGQPKRLDNSLSLRN